MPPGRRTRIIALLVLASFTVALLAVEAPQFASRAGSGTIVVAAAGDIARRGLPRVKQTL